jgi:hypothetical protein
MAAQMSTTQIQLENDKMYLEDKRIKAQQQLERDKLELAQKEFNHRQSMDLEKLNKNKSENESKLREEISVLNKTVSELIIEMRQLKEMVAKVLDVSKGASAASPSINNENVDSTLSYEEYVRRLRKKVTPFYSNTAAAQSTKNGATF